MINNITITATAVAGVLLMILLFRGFDIHGVEGILNHDVIQNLLLLAIAARITTTKS